MGETPHELDQEISRTRDHIDQDILALRLRTRREIERRIRTWMHPWLFAGAALATVLTIGFLLHRAVHSLSK